ncbi:MAG: hypothetical protein PHE29_06275, partial [Tissierellia bacterium]|nr:hypothetical protein [Tissierellia bacterium]
MINKSNNYRVMKFLEPINKKDKCKGYVRLDIRGQRGLIIVSVENIGDNKSTSDIFLYKDKKEKIKLGSVNNRKGMIKRNLTFAPNANINDYNVCAVVKDERIILYANLYSKVDVNDVKKLEETITSLQEDNEIKKSEEVKEVVKEKIGTLEKSSIEIETTKDEELESEEELEPEEELDTREELDIVKESEYEEKIEITE